MTRLFCLSLVIVLASDWSLSAQPKDPPKKFTNSLGMEFTLVPKGKSWLGGGNGKEGTKEGNMAQDFYLGVYLVTQEEWEKVMGKNPSHFSRGGKGADAVKDIADGDLKRFPMENVSWEDAKQFVKLLNEKVKKNRLGLFDMHGNVWEWCENQFDPKEGPARVSRGGCWRRDADDCRAADRRGSAPSLWDNILGFRLARVPSTSK